jgi:hypothetical protein
VSKKDKSKGAAAAAVGVSLATAGLSSCGDGGSGIGPIDPLPPPLVCANVNTGQSLAAEGERIDGDFVRVLIQNREFDVQWGDIQVSDVVGARLVEVAVFQDSQSIRLVFELDEGVGNGSFAVAGTMIDRESKSCNFARTFTLTVDGDTVTVSFNILDSLPLFARDRAEVVLLAHAENVVEVEARTSYGGPYTVEWTVSEGDLENVDGNRAQWRLPPKPGFYQIEAAMDYGEAGLAFDSMMFEVVLGENA